MMTNYSMTGSNPHLSTNQFQNNGIGDFITPKVIWDILSMGSCLDAPICLPAGSCSSNWTVQVYVERF